MLKVRLESDVIRFAFSGKIADCLVEERKNLLEKDRNESEKTNQEDNVVIKKL